MVNWRAVDRDKIAICWHLYLKQPFPSSSKLYFLIVLLLKCLKLGAAAILTGPFSSHLGWSSKANTVFGSLVLLFLNICLNRANFFLLSDVGTTQCSVSHYRWYSMIFVWYSASYILDKWDYQIIFFVSLHFNPGLFPHTNCLFHVFFNMFEQDTKFFQRVLSRFSSWCPVFLGLFKRQIILTLCFKFS